MMITCLKRKSSLDRSGYFKKGRFEPVKGRKRRFECEPVQWNDPTIDIIIEEDFIDLTIKKSRITFNIIKPEYIELRISRGTHYSTYDNPGQYAAIDIQRIVRGWLERKNITFWLGLGSNNFSYDRFMLMRNTIYYES